MNGGKSLGREIVLDWQGQLGGVGGVKNKRRGGETVIFELDLVFLFSKVICSSLLEGDLFFILKVICTFHLEGDQVSFFAEIHCFQEEDPCQVSVIY